MFCVQLQSVWSQSEQNEGMKEFVLLAAVKEGGDPARGSGGRTSWTSTQLEAVHGDEGGASGLHGDEGGASGLDAVHGDEGGASGLSADHHEGEPGELWQLVAGGPCREKPAASTTDKGSILRAHCYHY